MRLKEDIYDIKTSKLKFNKVFSGVFMLLY